MNKSAAVNPLESFINSFNIDLSASYPTQDADLIRQLPFIPGLKEILMLRQVHGLEHATVWILSESLGARWVDNHLLGGLSTEQGFYLYGQVNKTDLHRAVAHALQRLNDGESDLAVHPRCGTNLSVELLLTFGLAVGAHLLLPRTPIEQILGLGMAATAAANLAPELGMQAQRYITTAIPFNLEIVDITVKPDSWGRTAHFVRVRWSEITGA